MAKQGFAPRKAAVDLLNDVLGEKRMLSEALPEIAKNLPPDEQARANRLATNCLRWMDRADRMLGPYLREKPPLEAHNILRLALVEIFHDKQQSHGVVDTAVDLARSYPGSKRAAGLVNAVLRRASRLDADRWNQLPIPRLPKWLRKQLLATYGKETVAAIEMAHSKGAPLDITAKGDPKIVAQKLGGDLLPTGTIRINRQVQVSDLAGYEAGDWWVQDVAAALPANILAARAGERVLDMCAAPGGKAMQLAANGAAVVALDSSERRMDRARENFERTGLKVEIRIQDALEFQDDPYDAVLLDAPCSATGTIRRHPDLPYIKDGKGFEGLRNLQSGMLDRAIALLKPGGRLVYCTCSLLPGEGEDQISSALKRHKDMRVDKAGMQMPGIDRAWLGETGLRTRPDYMSDVGGMDGFFISLLRKSA